MFHVSALSWALRVLLAELEKELGRTQTPVSAHACPQRAPGPSLAVLVMTGTILVSTKPPPMPLLLSPWEGHGDFFLFSPISSPPPLDPPIVFLCHNRKLERSRAVDVVSDSRLSWLPV